MKRERKTPRTFVGGNISGLSTSQGDAFVSRGAAGSGGNTAPGGRKNCILAQITGPQTTSMIGGVSYTGYPWQQITMTNGVPVPTPGGLTSQSTTLAVDANDPNDANGAGGSLTTGPYKSNSISTSPYPTGTVLEICQDGSGLFSFGEAGALAITDSGTVAASNFQTFYNPKEIIAFPGLRFIALNSNQGQYELHLDLNVEDQSHALQGINDVKFDKPMTVTANGSHGATVSPGGTTVQLQVLTSLASGSLDCTVTPPVLHLTFNTATLNFKNGILIPAVGP